MIVDTLLVFYYEKLVGYMSASFADLGFAGERIEVGLKRGKFDYVSLAGTRNRRTRTAGAKRKEGDAHAVTLTPSWSKPQQASHGTHQYAQHHRVFWPVPEAFPAQRSSSQGRPCQHKEGPLRLWLQPNLTQPVMPTLAWAPTWEETLQQRRLWSSPRSQCHTGTSCHH